MVSNCLKVTLLNSTSPIINYIYPAAIDIIITKISNGFLFISVSDPDSLETGSHAFGSDSGRFSESGS